MKKGVYINYAILSNLKTYYAANILIFVAYPFLISLYLLLESKRVALHDLGIDQGSDNTGIAEKKYVFRIILVDTFLNITEPLAAYYKSKNDLENYRKLKFTRSQLLKARPEALLEIVDGVIAFCPLHQADCTTVGITAGKLAKLTADRNNFEPYANLPKKTIKLKKGITTKINTLNTEVSDIITFQLDGAMRAIIDDEPQAYSDYTLITEPIREGVHSHNIIVAKAPVNFKAIHDLTGEPVADAPFKISGIKGTFTTNAEGKIMANLPLGVYICKIAFIDFVPQSFTFTLTAEGIELTIRMVPVGV